MSDLKKGDRCRLSAEAKRALKPRHAERHGFVVGKGKYTVVLWDGVVTRQTYAHEYIEKVEETPAEPCP